MYVSYTRFEAANFIIWAEGNKPEYWIWCHSKNVYFIERIKEINDWNERICSGVQITHAIRCGSIKVCFLDSFFFLPSNFFLKLQVRFNATRCIWIRAQITRCMWIGVKTGNGKCWKSNQKAVLWNIERNWQNRWAKSKSLFIRWELRGSQG